MPTLGPAFEFLLEEGPKLFSGCESLLYIGHRRDTDVWWHQSFAKALGIRRIAVVDINHGNLMTAAHVTAELYHGDLRRHDIPYFDIAFWDEGPEHLPREESLAACQFLMRRHGNLIVSCPWGFQVQGSDPGDHEFHHWGPMPRDFESIGMTTRTFGTMFEKREGRSTGHGNLIGWGSLPTDTMPESDPVNPDETGAPSNDRPKASLAVDMTIASVTPSHILPCRDCGLPVEIKSVSCGSCSGPTEAERDALRAVLVRETTAKVAHGGLRGLLGLNHDEAEALVSFLKRV